MDRLLYYLVLALVKVLQALPLRVVAHIGRTAGALFYWLDVRHRRVARTNLTHAFGHELSRAEIRALTRENFRRIGENYCCAVRTAGMTFDELRPYCEFVGVEKLLVHRAANNSPNIVVAIGHFGNFELYARYGQFVPGFRCATTYRGLPQPSLDRLMQSLRQQSGCMFFERRTDAAALKAVMGGSGLILGLLADQHAGRGGARLPFFGREAATSIAPAVFALRYDCPLFTGICYRVGLGRWRIEAGDEIPTHEDGRPRASVEITQDINLAFEEAIRRDPANWFWVHNRWKPSRAEKNKNASARAHVEPQPTDPVGRI